MKSVPKATIYLDKRNPLSDKTFPVTLRIYFEKKAKFYRIRGKYNDIPGFTKEEFEKIYSRKAPYSLKKYKDVFEAIEKGANDTIASINHFSFDIFKEKFFSSISTQNIENNLFAYLDKEIKFNQENGKYSSASIYKTTKGHLESFYKKKSLIFQEITPKFLNKLETWIHLFHLMP